jgi:tRNA pseudouridine32 synthase/23S rRNA pseudouridine746 synthase
MESQIVNTDALNAIDILYRDALILVINKPSGLPVHPGAGGGITLVDYFPHWQYGLPNAPALVHRLDKDTSGCLILGRQKEGLRRMERLFHQGNIQKIYYALVAKRPDLDHGSICLPLIRQSKRRNSWWMRIANPDEEGCQTAQSDYHIIQEYQKGTLIALMPKTGRTHQLRVHCAAMGWPIIGDTIYGNHQQKENNQGPMCLHAAKLTIPLYPKCPALNIEAPLPSHMQNL